jgi:large subunit ribosomal protein L18
VQGTAERPRMSVFVSNRHLYVQLIDDGAQKTLAPPPPRRKRWGRGARTISRWPRRLGQLAAKIAQDLGIKQVVLDRGGFTYGGRIKALADAARAAGLQF